MEAVMLIQSCFALGSHSWGHLAWVSLTKSKISVTPQTPVVMPASDCSLSTTWLYGYQICLNPVVVVCDDIENILIVGGSFFGIVGFEL